ncbi:hypothetical protein [Photobacterium leiognathi]|uniref:hypothetical protein n=1 Tax=Photobacterium leiognathi TaxID=553611 RepID=UPI00273543B8|nr:hypothetical protein [Photobacterium leiognathi]
MINCASLTEDDEKIAFLDPESKHVTEHTIKAGTVLLKTVLKNYKSLQQKLLVYLQQPTNDTLDDTRECDVRVIASVQVRI